MKFVVGNIPEDESFDPINEGWSPLKEPENLILAQIIAIPITIILVLIVYGFAYYFNVFRDVNLNFGTFFLVL